MQVVVSGEARTWRTHKFFDATPTFGHDSSSTGTIDLWYLTNRV